MLITHCYWQRRVAIHLLLLLCPGTRLAAAQKPMDMYVLQLPMVSFENQLEGEYVLSSLLG